MRLHTISRYVGLLLLVNALFLGIGMIISIINHDSGTYPLMYSMLVTVIFGWFPMIYVPPAQNISKNEGFLIVIFGWLITCLVGALPFVLWGGEFTFTNAWFESVSGFTTTGSTILNDIEALPMGLLFWRSSTHWLGGIGVVMLSLVILPNIGHARFVLLRTEMSEVAESNFRYQTKRVLKILLIVYVGLTVAETILLWIFGMDLFDALMHSFATIATGGFSTKNLSIYYYHSVAIEVIIMVFMVLSGIHFGLLFATIIRRSTNIFNSVVVRYYVLSMLVGILFVSLNVHGKVFPGFFESLRYASFQVVSLGTTTGFATIDTKLWPAFSQLILIFFTLQCACAGSTSGGIKVDRIVILLKSIQLNIKRIHHPRAIFTLKLENHIIEDEIIKNAVVFIVLYLLIVFFSGVALTSLGMDSMTALSASAATMGNVGPGFGGVSSMGNFHNVPELGKWILSANMLLGRLEIYGFIALLWMRRT
ncbi:MAG: TrkH family potassium uptake protein [Bacteroidales bacterium]|nr:TrkH family potassium uptake protein [Bacteroidales bacterium]